MWTGGLVLMCFSALWFLLALEDREQGIKRERHQIAL